MRDRSRADQDLAALLLVRRSRLRRVRSGHRLAAGLTAAALIVVAVVAGAAVGGRSLLLGSCTLNALQPVALGQNSFLYAKNGSLLGVVPSSAHRQPLRLDQMSSYLPKATVAIEDRRFWQHGALDYQGIVRALYSDVAAGRIVEGGSTITQELARNLYLGGSQRTFSRKVKEACIALKLAQTWPKKRILTAYLNEVFYGRAAHGAQAGAETFFSRRARDLTLPQAALLAGLPQAPSVYDPLLHPAIAMRRRDDVLRAMLANRVITSAGVRAGVGVATRPEARDAVRRAATAELLRLGGAAARRALRRAPRRRGRARRADDARPGHGVRGEERGARRAAAASDPAAAVVAIDPSTGAVRAMVSYVPDGRKLTFNLATQSTRTAGSSFKPFVLATAILHGISLYSSFSGPPSLVVPDHICDGPQGPWDVHNYADENGGYMNLLNATANSVNTIFAQLVARVGPENVVPVAQRMGITTQLQPVCSITLGTQPVNPLEMTDAYATLAAHGVHHAPQPFELVRAPNGQVLGRLSEPGDQALPRGVADQVTYALEGVVQHGTASPRTSAGRPPARRARPSRSRTRGSAGTCRSSRRASGSAIRRPRSRSTTSRASAPSPAARCRRRSGTGSWRRRRARMPVLGFPTPAITGTTVYGSGYTADDDADASSTCPRLRSSSAPGGH